MRILTTKYDVVWRLTQDSKKFFSFFAIYIERKDRSTKTRLPDRLRLSKQVFWISQFSPKLNRIRIFDGYPLGQHFFIIYSLRFRNNRMTLTATQLSLPCSIESSYPIDWFTWDIWGVSSQLQCIGDCYAPGLVDYMSYRGLSILLRRPL